MATVEGKAKVTVDGVQAGKQLEGLEKKATDFKKQLIELKKQPLLDSKKIKDTEAKLRAVNKEIKSVKAQTVSYDKVLKNLSGASLKELQAAYRKLNIETSKLDRTTTQYKKNAGNLARIQTEIKKVKAEMRGAGTATKGFGAGIKNIATTMFAGGGILAAFFALKRILSSAFNIITDFGKATSTLGAITGKTSQELSGLKQQAKDLGSTTAHTATNVIEMQTELARLGFSLREIEDSTPAMLDLASAVGVNLADAAQVAGGIIRAFGLDTSEAKDVVDSLVATTNNSGAAFDDYREAVKLSAPIFKAANIDYKTMNLLIGKLADSQIKGSLAGTGLKNLVSKLSDESSSLSKELGFTVKNSDDLVRAFKVLKDKNIDLTAATELTDERSKAAFLTLIEGVDSADKLALALENLDDNAKKTAETMLDNLSGDITKAQSAWEGFILSLEDGNGVLSDILRSITQTGTGLLNMLTVLNNEYGSNAEKAHEMNKAASETIPLWDFQMETIGLLIPPLRGLREETEKMYEAEQTLNNFIDANVQKMQKMKKALEDQIKADEEAIEKQKKLTDEQKKAIKERLKANQQLHDQIEVMNVALIADERERSIAEVELWKEKELRKVKESKAAAELKAQAVEAIESTHKDKLLDIEDKYNKDLIKKLEVLEGFIYQQNAQFETEQVERQKREIKAIEDKYDKQIEIAREAAEKDSALKEKFAQIEIDLEKKKEDAISKYKVDKEKEAAQERFKTRQKYGLISSEEQIKKERKELKEAYEKGLLDSTEYHKADKKIVEDYEKQKQQIRKNLGINSLFEDLKSNLDEIEKLYDDSLISYQEFILASGIAISEAFQELTNQVTGIFEQIYTQEKEAEFIAIDDTTQKRKTELDKQTKDRLKALNEQLKKGLISEKNYNKQKEDLERESADEETRITESAEERKKSINKKYADKEFVITASRIIADTASAAIKAYASLGPIAGAIAAGIITAFGLRQLDLANEQRQRVKGLEEGGEFPVTRAQDGKKFKARYSGEKRGYIDRPTVLVGEHNKQEFVVSNKSLQIPAFQRAVSAIDSYQKGQGLKYFNYKRVNKAMGVVQGMEEGGTFGTSSSGTRTGPNNQASEEGTQMVSLLMALIQKFDEFTTSIETWQSEIEVYVEIQKIRDADDELSSLETDVRLG